MNQTGSAGATLNAPCLDTATEETIVSVLANIRMMADFFLNADKNEVVLRPATMITASDLLNGWADGIRSALRIEEV